jgi:hypoxanthine phosphoribosyltransferase
MTTLHEVIEEVLVTEEEIDAACQRLAAQVSLDYKDKEPLLVGLLKGCVPFIGDLSKYITINVQIDYMAVASYHGTSKSSNEVKIEKDLKTSVEGRHVIIAEDIVDTGATLQKVIGLFEYRGAKSVEVVTLLNKQDGRKVRMKPKYVGIEIPNKFVVGYGLDWADYYRNLPYIGVVKKELL